jgi:phosphate transport system substrate-binding protein
VKTLWTSRKTLNWIKGRSLLCMVVLLLSWWPSSPVLAEVEKAQEEEVLTWSGCGITLNAFMEEIAAAFKKKTGIAIKLMGGGATLGIRAVAAGTSDVGGTCRHWLGGTEHKDPQEAGAQLIQIAWDAIVVIANPANPVTNISLTDLKKVFDGEIVSWRELGGQDRKIALVDRLGKDSGVGYMFRLMVFGDADYEFKARAYEVKSSSPVENKVAKSETALALDGISSARRSQVKVLDLNGVAPTKTNVASGKYPLFRPLYLTVGPNPAPRVKKLIDFILSPEGQAVIAAQQTVNLEEGKALVPLWETRKKGLGL